MSLLLLVYYFFYEKIQKLPCQVYGFKFRDENANFNKIQWTQKTTNKQTNYKAQEWVSKWVIARNRFGWCYKMLHLFLYCLVRFSYVSHSCRCGSIETLCEILNHLHWLNIAHIHTKEIVCLDVDWNAHIVYNIYNTHISTSAANRKYTLKSWQRVHLHF